MGLKRFRRVAVIANQGEIAGGEIMQLRVAAAIQKAGIPVRIICPEHPAELAQRSEFPTTTVPGKTRRAYALNLRKQKFAADELLWCNGLLPVVALAGRKNRLLHLHQLPQNRVQWWLYRLAKLRSIKVLVPSVAMQKKLPKAVVLPNWTPKLAITQTQRSANRKIGFLGRTSLAKGVDVLIQAVALLRTQPGFSDVRLVLYGEFRFVSEIEQAKLSQLFHESADFLDRPGWVTPTQALSEVDLIAFPTREFEPFGLVTIEAMSARVPVVISDAPALPEVAGDHPWVARAGDAQSLATVLAAALTAPNRAAEDAGLLRWETHFSPKVGERNVADILASIGVVSD